MSDEVQWETHLKNSPNSCVAMRLAAGLNQQWHPSLGAKIGVSKCIRYKHRAKHSHWVTHGKVEMLLCYFIVFSVILCFTSQRLINHTLQLRFP